MLDRSFGANSYTTMLHTVYMFMCVAVFAGLSDVCYCYQAAHQSLIDALMVAWCATVASVDRVVQAVRSGPVHFRHSHNLLLSLSFGYCFV